MSDREEIQALKASRSGYKSALTRARNVAESSLEDYVVGDDPILLENFIGHWDARLQKYLDAEDQVICGLASDVKDADPAVDEHVKAFFKAKSIINGFRRDVEANLVNVSLSNQGSSLPPNSRQDRFSLPKTVAKKPPMLEEDLDHKDFTRWRPLWNNYSQLIYLDQRDRTTPEVVTGRGRSRPRSHFTSMGQARHRGGPQVAPKIFVEVPFWTNHGEKPQISATRSTGLFGY